MKYEGGNGKTASGVRSLYLEKAAGGASLVRICTMVAHLDLPQTSLDELELIAFLQCRVVPGKGCLNGSGHVKALDCAVKPKRQQGI